jgi:AraC-like DNA-binding protein
MSLKYDTACGYFPVNDKAFAAGFYLTGAGVEHMKPHDPYPLPSHPDMYDFSWHTGRVLPEYQVVYVCGGEGEFESRETGLIHVHADMAMILLPDVWHRYRPNTRTGWNVYWISFNGLLPHLWQQAGILEPSSVVRKVTRAKTLAQNLGNIVQTAVEKPDDGVPASFAALAVLAGLLGRDGPGMAAPANRANAKATPRSDDAVAHAALGIVWNYSHRNLSVGGIARQLGITRRKLERRFLAARKRTVLEELTACRLARAQRMLQETHLPIKRIALAAGFSSSTHLAVACQRERGMTPTQLRSSALLVSTA